MGKAKGKTLNTRQRAFVEAYLVCWNAAEAVRQAGYSGDNADVVGSRMLVNVSIKAEIDARLAKMGMNADEVLARLTSQARGSLEPFMQQIGESITFDLTTPEAKANLHLIKKLRTKRRRYGKEDNETEELETEIEIHDPQAALVHIGRHYGLFIDKMASGEDVYREHMEKWRNAVSSNPNKV